MMLAFLFMIIMPIVTISGMVFTSTQNEIEENYLASAQGQVRQVDDYIGAYLNGLSQDCAFLAQNTTVKRIDDSLTAYMNKPLNEDGFIPMTPASNGGIETEIYALFRDYALSHPEVVCVYLGSEEGGYVQWPQSKLERQYDPRKRAWYQHILSQRDQVVVTDPYYAIATDDLAVITTGKVIEDDGGRVIGIQAVDVSLDGLTEMVRKKRIGRSGFVILIDSEGTILAHPQNSDLNFQSIDTLGLDRDKIMTQSDTERFDMRLENKIYSASTYTSDNLGWTYLTMIEKEEITQSVDRVRDMIVLLSSGLTIVFITIAIVLSNQFSIPLVSALQQLKRIELGDYSNEMPVELLSREDDLGVFIKAVDAMRGDIYELMTKVEDTVDSATTDPRFLADMKKQTKNASIQVASTLERFVELAENEARNKEAIEKKLEITKVSLQQAQKIAQIWTWEWEVHEGLFQISDEMKQILGLDFEKTHYTIDELNELVHPEDQDYFKRALNYVWHGESIGIEFRFLASDQTIIWVHQNGNVIYDEADKIISVLFMNHDITERKESLNKLRLMNENLIQMVKDEVEENRKKDAVIVYQSRLAKMGQMIGLITHQWKQPLNNLGLILANLKDASEHDDLTLMEINESMADSKRIINQMAKTIDDFRYFFNPNPQWERFSPNDTIEFAIELIEETVKLNNISIETHLACTEQINGYSNEFTQVVFNILDNAKDAILNNGTESRLIRIDAYDSAGAAVVDIFNNGSPIPEPVLDKLFEPYFTTKNKEKGTGIGLYMSKMIIENHMAGQIVCINVSKGVLFRIMIPVNGGELDG
jgi:signal transduction histidine kinase